MNAFNRFYVRTFAVAFGLILMADQVASACPTCKEAAAINGGDTASGYFWSILFMLSMPPLIFSGISLYFYMLIRRARADAAARASNPDAADAGETPELIGV